MNKKNNKQKLETSIQCTVFDRYLTVSFEVNQSVQRLRAYVTGGLRVCVEWAELRFSGFDCGSLTGARTYDAAASESSVLVHNSKLRFATLSGLYISRDLIIYIFHTQDIFQSSWNAVLLRKPAFSHISSWLSVSDRSPSRFNVRNRAQCGPEAILTMGSTLIK